MVKYARNVYADYSDEHKIGDIVEVNVDTYRLMKRGTKLKVIGTLDGSNGQKVRVEPFEIDKSNFEKFNSAAFKVANLYGFQSKNFKKVVQNGQLVNNNEMLRKVESFLIIDETQNIYDSANTIGDALKIAKQCASDDEGISYHVYQRVKSVIATIVVMD